MDTPEDQSLEQPALCLAWKNNVYLKQTHPSGGVIQLVTVGWNISTYSIM